MHKVGDALHDASASVKGAAHDVTTGISDAAGHVAHDVREAAGHAMHEASEAAGHFAEGAQHLAVDFADATRGQARRIERGLQHTFETNPLALGAVALAVGAAVGFALPRTANEDALMGETRDHVLGNATHMAHDAAESIQHLVGDARAHAKDALGSTSKHS
ncbi:hypothetical protein EON77_12785 [bacterium]|nr:MAG: hypothetical protein EON77_12785 [bacterium]